MQRGRKSVASLAVVTADNSRELSRLCVPPGLSEGEQRVWVMTVNSKPAEWFGTEHGPLLVSYVRHVVNADVVDQQIKVFDPEWLKDDAGLSRYEKLLTMFRHETQMVQVLARAMRLTQQAQYRADKAATLSGKVRGRKPWQG